MPEVLTTHLKADAIRHRMIDLNIENLRDLAAKAGVDYTNLSKAMKHEREPSKLMFIRLAWCLSLDFNSILEVTAEPAAQAA